MSKGMRVVLIVGVLAAVVTLLVVAYGMVTHGW
jgi:hypothetical protein